MTPDHMALLRRWNDRMVAMEAQYDALVALTGSSPEAPLMRAIADLQAFATVAVQDAIGDEHGWCNYYWLEKDMGSKAIDLMIGRKSFTLRTVDDLAAIITEHANA